MDEPVLVGREKELSELRHFFDLATQAKGTTVFISGEAGAGKSRLVREFLNSVKNRGAALLSGWCLSDAQVPYFPFVGAFDSYFGGDESRDNQEAEPLGHPTSPTNVWAESFGITTWLTNLGPIAKSAGSEVFSPQVWKDQLFAAVGKTLHSIAAEAPTILLVEDIHWADSASLALLHYISRIIGSERILLLATFRSEELTTDSEGHEHPLVGMMRLMGRENLFAELKLSSLSQADVSRVIETMMCGNVESDFACKLSNESRGNALFVVEAVRMLAERKSLVQEGNHWRLGVSELAIPSKIKDIILSRLSTLKFTQRRVLDAASVIGEKFDTELLAAVLGQDSVEVLETLTNIARSTSLVSNEGNFYKFDHAKSREILYTEIPALLRKGYHNRIAERMENAGKTGRFSPSDLAYHYEHAENLEKATKFALAAASEELARFSNTEASKHFKYVLDKTVESPETIDSRTKAMEGLGDAFYAMSLLEEAKIAFEMILQTTLSGALKLRALKKVMLCYYWQGNIQLALQTSVKAEDYAKFDAVEYARLCLHRGFIIGRAGKIDESIENMERALRVFEAAGSLSDIGEALVELTFIYRSKGRLADAFSAGIRSERIFEELGDLRGQGLALNRLAGPFSEIQLRPPRKIDIQVLKSLFPEKSEKELAEDFSPGSANVIQKALECLKTSSILEEKIGDYNLLALNHWGQGQGLENAREFKEALAESLKGMEYAQKTGGFFVQALCLCAIIGQYSILRDTEHAEEFSKRLDKLLDDVPSLKNNRNVIGMRLSTQGRLFIAKGQVENAKESFESFIVGNYSQSPMTEAAVQEGLGWTLLHLQRIQEAKVHFEEAMRIRQIVRRSMEQLGLQTALVIPNEVLNHAEFKVRLDMVNVTGDPLTLLTIDSLVSSEFNLIAQPNYVNLQGTSLNLNGKTLNAYSVEPLNITLQASKPGIFEIAPEVTYRNNLGTTETAKLRIAKVTVYPALQTMVRERPVTSKILPNRSRTGFLDLDVLLQGGIPDTFAVLFASPMVSERELIINRYIEVGVEDGETIFYMTADLGNAKSLAEKYASKIFLFICNSQADSAIQDSPSIFKMKGVENLTGINIALTKALRTLSPNGAEKRRACIDATSDVLLQHRAVITRKWLNEIIQTLKSKEFTTMVVLNPRMHPQQEVEALLDLFEGEIRITERDNANGTDKVLKIQKLRNAEYLEIELAMQRENLKLG